MFTYQYHGEQEQSQEKPYNAIGDGRLVALSPVCARSHLPCHDQENHGELAGFDNSGRIHFKIEKELK